MPKKQSKAAAILDSLPSTSKLPIETVLGSEAVTEIKQAVADVMARPITERPSLTAAWKNLEAAYKTGYGKGGWESFLKRQGWRSE